MATRRGCAAVIPRLEEGKLAAGWRPRARGQPSWEGRGGASCAGRFLRCLLGAERRRWESGVGRGAPGDGWRGRGREASGRALGVPGVRPAGTSAAKARTRERSALDGEGGRGEAPGRPAPTRRLAPGVSRHPPWRPRPPPSCANLSRGAGGAGGCGEEAGLGGNGVLLFCFLSRCGEAFIPPPPPPRYLGFCNLFGENFCASRNKARLKNRSVENARFINTRVPVGAFLGLCLQCV